MFFMSWKPFLLKRSIFTILKKIFTILLFIGGIPILAAAQQKQAGLYDSGTKVLKYYPNPASSIINFEIIKGSSSHYTLQLYNFMGRKISETVGGSEKVTIMLDGLYRGVYIFQLRDIYGKIVDSGKFQVVN